MRPLPQYPGAVGPLEAIKTALHGLLALLGHQKEKDQRVREALGVFADALAATEQRYRASEQSDKPTDGELADHWRKAAVALSGIDEDLARSCGVKGNSWATGLQFSEDYLKDSGIELATMQQRFVDALSNVTH